MSQKDVIKLILILHGYDKDITIKSRRCEDDIRTEMFDVYASNDEGDTISFMEPGLEMMLTEIFRHFHPESYDGLHNHLWIGAYIKDLLNDEWRQKQKDDEQEHLNKCKEWKEKNKEYFDFLENNHPCKDCKINKHDHWDFIHHNCELNHSMKCKILKKFYEDANKLKRK